MCSCHSIPESCVMFCGVKLSMGSFILFIICLSPDVNPTSTLVCFIMFQCGTNYYSEIEMIPIFTLKKFNAKCVFPTPVGATNNAVCDSFINIFSLIYSRNVRAILDV